MQPPQRNSFNLPKMETVVCGARWACAGWKGAGDSVGTEYTAPQRALQGNCPWKVQNFLNKWDCRLSTWELTTIGLVDVSIFKWFIRLYSSEKLREGARRQECSWEHLFYLCSLGTWPRVGLDFVVLGMVWEAACCPQWSFSYLTLSFSVNTLHPASVGSCTSHPPFEQSPGTALDLEFSVIKLTVSSVPRPLRLIWETGHRDDSAAQFSGGFGSIFLDPPPHLIPTTNLWCRYNFSLIQMWTQ